MAKAVAQVRGKAAAKAVPKRGKAVVKAAAKRGKAANAEPDLSVHASAIAKLLNRRLDGIEKKQGLIAGANLTVGHRQSTGLLVNDFILGGGLVPGMYAYSGPEQSAKSTLAMTTLGSLVRARVPSIQYFDAEGSIDPTYTGGILKVRKLSDIFGLRTKKGWAIDPKARYYQDNILETFFDTLAEVLNVLPNKIYLPEEDTWALTFTGKRVDLDTMGALGLKPDKALTQVYGKRVCPIDDRNLQAAIVIDSWPSLVLDSVDEEAEARNDMALDARAFSKHLKRVVGKLRRKSAVLLGINQIRLKPAVQYGNPEYEPGGEALKFYSSVRNQIRALSVPQGWGKGPFLEEESVQLEGGTDVYHFKRIRNTKNKTFQPMLEGWARIWVADAYGNAHGFDPVFDTFEYLKLTNQMQGNKGKFTVPLGALKGVTLSFAQFKMLVLAEHFNDLALLKAFKAETGVRKPPKLRALCFEQLASGKFADLYNAGGDEEYEEYEDGDDIEDEE